MNRAAVIDRLRASLLEAQSELLAEDYERVLDLALAALSARRPRTVFAELALAAGQAHHPCPAELLSVLACDWGMAEKAALSPWDDNWPGRLPTLCVTYAQDGRRLSLLPAPSARQIGLLGAVAPYRYGAAHLLTDTACSLDEALLALLLLRAQAEVMRELAMKHATKPYQLRDGVSAQPRNGMPGYLYSVLMDEFERRVCA